MKLLASLDIDMCNVHASRTIAMMEAAIQGLTKKDGSRPILVAVTQLTSTSQDGMQNDLLIEKPEFDDFLQTIEYTYPNFHLTMHCFFCHVVKGSINYVEHTAGCWLTESEFDSVKWLPADLDVI